ncbi:hypothetical protein SAMN05216189_10631, partial [Pseudomonas delhiensis]
TPNGPLSRLRGRVREGERSQGSRASSLLRRAKAALALVFGFPEKHPSAPERPFRRLSETGAQEVMRHGCRESPDQHRDVLSGRASVAGEFARVARLHRARMSGQAFLVTFCGGGLPPFDKSDSPEGAKQKTSEHSERRATPNPKPLVSRVRGYPPFPMTKIADGVRSYGRQGSTIVGADSVRDWTRRPRRTIRWPGQPAQRPLRSISLGTYLPISYLPMAMRCTSSGPSARRKVRCMAYQ